MDELIKSGIEQGLGYALFIFLLLYVLKTTGEREKKYQETIDKLAEQTGINKEIKNDVEEIIKDVNEIKNKINS